MLKTINPNNEWEFVIDDETRFTLKPFAGALTSGDMDHEYFKKCIVEATGFVYAGKEIRHWKKTTGQATYMNNKQAYIGMIPWSDILPPKVASDLLLDIIKHSTLEDGERKNSQ